MNQQQNINSAQLTTMDPNAFNYQSELEQVKRRKAYADALRQTQMPEGRMIGQVYAAPHWGAQLAAALQKGLGGYEARKAAEAGEQVETRRQAEIARMLGQYKPETTTPQEQLALAQGLEGLGAGGLANAAFRMRDQDLDRQAQAAAAAREEAWKERNFEQKDREIVAKNDNKQAEFELRRELAEERSQTQRELAEMRAVQAAGVADSRSAAEREKAEQKFEADRRERFREFDEAEATTKEAQRLLAQGPTGSGVGAIVDKGLGFVGQSTESGIAANELETVAGWLTTKVPRFEGPQSDKDVILYNQMAAKVGDRTVPVKDRQAAAQTMLGLQRKYRGIIEQQSFGGEPRPAASQAPAGRVVTMAQVQAKAAQTGLPVETVIEQARAAGFSIGQ